MGKAPDILDDRDEHLKRYSIRKSFTIGEPNTIWHNLVALLEKEVGRMDEFPTEMALLYHISDSTALLEYCVNENQEEGHLHYLKLILAASNIGILNRDFEVFLGYVRKANSEYDVSQIKEAI